MLKCDIVDRGIVRGPGLGVTSNGRGRSIGKGVQSDGEAVDVPFTSSC